AVVVVQHKGWRYHELPAMSFAITAIGCALAVAFAADLAMRSRRASTLAVIVIATASLTAVTLGNAFSDTRDRAAEIRPLVELVSQATSRRALFLSTNVSHAFPVVNYARATWPYRYHILYPLPGFYSGFDPATAGAAFRSPAEMGLLEARFF